MDSKILIMQQKEQKHSPVNDDAVELISGTLERLQAGKVVAIAVIEVYANGDVVTHYSASDKYHHLNSGAARLSARMAME